MKVVILRYPFIYCKVYCIVNDTKYGTSIYIIFCRCICMRDKMSCASCNRKIKDDDACVFLRRENGTNYVFDSYVCAEIFQKLNHVKRNVNIREIVPFVK
jgi:hypothetical protein